MDRLHMDRFSDRERPTSSPTKQKDRKTHIWEKPSDNADKRAMERRTQSCMDNELRKTVDESNSCGYTQQDNDWYRQKLSDIEVLKEQISSLQSQHVGLTEKRIRGLKNSIEQIENSETFKKIQKKYEQYEDHCLSLSSSNEES